jgi:uncharacterized phage protein (TIGR01671 family)
MREILFRGKTAQGDWIFGDIQTPKPPFERWYMWSEKGFQKEVNPETVGQFTGLTDKNGVKIFEHDLFQVAGNKVYEVVYCDFDNSYDGEGIYCCFALFDRKRNTKIAFDDYAMKNGEIIGNVHDTKNLLEQNND